jgi:hypothetical protein
MLVRDGKDKEADRLVTRIDPGVVSLVAELRGQERRVVGKLGLWKTHHEERKSLDASPAAIALAMICTREQLGRWSKRRWRCNWNWNWNRRPQHSAAIVIDLEATFPLSVSSSRGKPGREGSHAGKNGRLPSDTRGAAAALVHPHVASS